MQRKKNIKLCYYKTPAEKSAGVNHFIVSKNQSESLSYL